METEIFDRETMLDLVVNFIPLFILLFFVGVFLFSNPYGFDLLTSGLQFGIVVAAFVLLAILTYLSAVAIAGSERTDEVYPPGQATVDGQPTLHEVEQAEEETRKRLASESEDGS